MTYHRTQEQLTVPPAIEPISIVEAQLHLRLDGQFDADYVQSLITTSRTLLEQYCWSAFITQTWTYWFDRFWWKMFLPRSPIASGWNSGVITSTSCTGTTATVVLSTAAQDQFLSTLYVGETAIVSGVSVSGYNGSFPITAITATGFQYTVGSTLAAGTGGSAATGNNGGVQWVKYLPPQGNSAGPSSYYTCPFSIWETSAENQLTFIRAAWLQTYPITRGYRDDVMVQVVCGYGTQATDVPLPIRQAIKLLLTHLYLNRGEAPAEMPKAIDALIAPYRFKEF